MLHELGLYGQRRVVILRPPDPQQAIYLVCAGNNHVSHRQRQASRRRSGLSTNSGSCWLLMLFTASRMTTRLTEEDDGWLELFC